jgi:tetratricopeptide (TPR) repeat protein
MEINQTQGASTAPVKPKLVFFTYKYDRQLPDFLLIHHREHIKCLAESFDVTVVDESCDYQYVCDKYEPDLTLFESGLNILTCRRNDIRNTQACPQVPKVGFVNADAWCETRSGTLSEMDQWGVETLFSISVTAAEHAPEIADRLFAMPNFIDPLVHQDYGESKVIPVMLTGAQGPQYPWRRRVYKIVSEHYPSLSCPHGGYLVRGDAGKVMYGEQYARTINASFMAPTCGTLAKEVVRKHFEIPGCKACLITEKSAGLEAAGFVDMQNCVLADEHDVLDKISYLFQHPEELRNITEAGYQLVHSRHTLKHRDQLLQWLRLSRKVGANQRIVQPNPFEPLSIVERLGLKTPYIVSDGLHFNLLRQGDDKLTAGRYQEAEQLYLRCLNHMKMLPEAKLRLAVCNLYLGNAREAAKWIFEPIQYSLDEFKAADPDPVEWAYYIIALLCQGKLAAASRRARQFPELCNPELNRARWVVDVLKDRRPGVLTPAPASAKRRFSIHQLPNRDTDEWVERMCQFLEACGRSHWAEKLAAHQARESQGNRNTAAPRFDEPRVKRQERGRGEPSSNKVAQIRMPGSSQKAGLGSFKARLLLYKVQRKLRKGLSTTFRRLEAARVYRVPYATSERRKDQFYQAVEELAREQHVKTMLIVGASVREGTTEAVLMGARENRNSPLVLCIGGSASRRVTLRREGSTLPSVQWYEMSWASEANQVGQELRDTINRIKTQNMITHVDMLLMDGSEMGQLTSVDALDSDLISAGTVLLDDINFKANYGHYTRLLGDAGYVLVEHNPALRNGYAIFRKGDGVRPTFTRCEEPGGRDVVYVEE